MRNFFIIALAMLLAGTVSSSALYLTKSPGAATAVAGAAVLNGDAGIITTESLTTAAGSTYTLTLGSNEINSDSVVLATADWGSTTQGTPQITNIVVSVGKVVIIITNTHASLAFNGTLAINFLVLN
jgi:hypothetical protein